VLEISDTNDLTLTRRTLQEYLGRYEQPRQETTGGQRT
jgi:hypothetical protein